jgi:endo-1,4-beta-xylanase
MEVIGTYVGPYKVLRSYIGTKLIYDFTISDLRSVPPKVSSPMLGTLRDNSFPVGTAVKASLLSSNTLYTSIVKGGYDRISPENEMKFSRIRPSENTWDWSGADVVMKFARDNGKQVFWHAGVRGLTMPSWFNAKEGKVTPMQALQYIFDFIDAVLRRYSAPEYAGVLVGVDAINEPFEDNGALKNSPLNRMTGNKGDYIPRVIRHFNKRAPKLLTFINDYGQEYGSTAKINAAIAYKARCAAIGARLDGVGFQMHTVLRLTQSTFSARLNLAVNAGLMIHISELDILLNKGLDNTSQGAYPFLTPALDASAATVYDSIAGIYRALPESAKFGFTTWSIGDADNYINSSGNGGVQDYPGLRYTNYSPKPALVKMVSTAIRLKNPLVYDNYRAGLRSTLAGSATNGGRSSKAYALSGSGAGFGDLEVAATGLRAVNTANASFTFGTLDVGVSSFVMVFALSDLLPGNSTDKNIVGLFRYMSAINFLFFRPRNSDTSSVWVLGKKVNDQDTILLTDTVASSPSDIGAVIATGNILSLYVNGRFIGSVTEKAFNTQTKVGFRFRGDRDNISTVDFLAVDTL